MPEMGKLMGLKMCIWLSIDLPTFLSVLLCYVTCCLRAIFAASMLCGRAGQGMPPKGDVFKFSDLNLSLTPGHGTMLAFEPATTRHSTALADAAYPDCQRIGSAVSLQKASLYRAINAHADIKSQQAQIQSLQLQLVKARTQMGQRKNGEAKQSEAPQQTTAPAAESRKGSLVAL